MQPLASHEVQWVDIHCNTNVWCRIYCFIPRMLSLHKTAPRHLNLLRVLPSLRLPPELAIKKEDMKIEPPSAHANQPSPDPETLGEEPSHVFPADFIQWLKRLMPLKRSQRVCTGTIERRGLESIPGTGCTTSCRLRGVKMWTCVKDFPLRTNPWSTQLHSAS